MDESLFNRAYELVDECWESLKKVNYSELTEEEKETYNSMIKVCEGFLSKADWVKGNS